MTELEKMGGRAKAAAKALRTASAADKTAALQSIAAALRTKADLILSANGKDLADAAANGMVAYQNYNNGTMTDYIPTDEDLKPGFAGIPQFPGNEIK